jgi:hypothetical protein
LDDAAAGLSKRGGQPAITAAQVDNQPALHAGCLENPLGQFALGRLLRSVGQGQPGQNAAHRRGQEDDTLRTAGA